MEKHWEDLIAEADLLLLHYKGPDDIQNANLKAFYSHYASGQLQEPEKQTAFWHFLLKMNKNAATDRENTLACQLLLNCLNCGWSIKELLTRSLCEQNIDALFILARVIRHPSFGPELVLAYLTILRESLNAVKESNNERFIKLAQGIVTELVSLCDHKTKGPLAQFIPDYKREKSNNCLQSMNALATYSVNKNVSTNIIDLLNDIYYSRHNLSVKQCVDLMRTLLSIITQPALSDENRVLATKFLGVIILESTSSKNNKLAVNSLAFKDVLFSLVNFLMRSQNESINKILHLLFTFFVSIYLDDANEELILLKIEFFSWVQVEAINLLTVDTYVFKPDQTSIVTVLIDYLHHQRTSAIIEGIKAIETGMSDELIKTIFGNDVSTGELRDSITGDTTPNQKTFYLTQVEFNDTITTANISFAVIAYFLIKIIVQHCHDQLQTELLKKTAAIIQKTEVATKTSMHQLADNNDDDLISSLVHDKFKELLNQLKQAEPQKYVEILKSIEWLMPYLPLNQLTSQILLALIDFAAKSYNAECQLFVESLFLKFLNRLSRFMLANPYEVINRIVIGLINREADAACPEFIYTIMGHIVENFDSDDWRMLVYLPSLYNNLNHYSSRLLVGLYPPYIICQYTQPVTTTSSHDYPIAALPPVIRTVFINELRELEILKDVYHEEEQVIRIDFRMQFAQTQHTDQILQLNYIYLMTLLLPFFTAKLLQEVFSPSFAELCAQDNNTVCQAMGKLKSYCQFLNTDELYLFLIMPLTNYLYQHNPNTEVTNKFFGFIWTLLLHSSQTYRSNDKYFGRLYDPALIRTCDEDLIYFTDISLHRMVRDVQYRSGPTAWLDMIQFTIKQVGHISRRLKECYTVKAKTVPPNSNAPIQPQLATEHSNYSQSLETYAHLINYLFTLIEVLFVAKDQCRPSLERVVYQSHAALLLTLTYKDQDKSEAYHVTRELYILIDLIRPLPNDDTEQNRFVVRVQVDRHQKRNYRKQSSLIPLDREMITVLFQFLRRYIKMTNTKTVNTNNFNCAEFVDQAEQSIGIMHTLSTKVFIAADYFVPSFLWASAPRILTSEEKLLARMQENLDQQYLVVINFWEHRKMPNKLDKSIGHGSLRGLHQGELVPDAELSFWPDHPNTFLDNHFYFFRPQNGKFNTLEKDYEEEGFELPNHYIVLFSLKINKLVSLISEVKQESGKWSLVDNCSGEVGARSCIGKLHELLAQVGCNKLLHLEDLATCKYAPFPMNHPNGYARYLRDVQQREHEIYRRLSKDKQIPYAEYETSIRATDESNLSENNSEQQPLLNKHSRSKPN